MQPNIKINAREHDIVTMYMYNIYETNKAFPLLILIFVIPTPLPTLNDTMHTLSLSQAVQETTHMTSNGSETFLDLAFVSQTSQLKQCEVVPPIGSSDHYGLVVD